MYIQVSFLSGAHCSSESVLDRRRDEGIISFFFFARSEYQTLQMISPMISMGTSVLLSVEPEPMLNGFFYRPKFIKSSPAHL